MTIEKKGVTLRPSGYPPSPSTLSGERPETLTAHGMESGRGGEGERGGRRPRRGIHDARR
jgi:hypothetical protein